MPFWDYKVRVKCKHILCDKFINEASDVNLYHNSMFWLRIQYLASFKDIQRVITKLLYCFGKRVLGSQSLYNKVKVKQFCYKPGVTQRVPGS